MNSYTVLESKAVMDSRLLPAITLTNPAGQTKSLFPIDETKESSFRPVFDTKGSRYYAQPPVGSSITECWSNPSPADFTHSPTRTGSVHSDMTSPESGSTCDAAPLMGNGRRSTRRRRRNCVSFSTCGQCLLDHIRNLLPTHRKTPRPSIHRFQVITDSKKDLPGLHLGSRKRNG